MWKTTRGVLPYIGYIGMCGSKRTAVFGRFGHEKGVNFSHFGHI